MEQQPDYITETEEALKMLGKGYNNDPIPPTEFRSTLSGATPVPDALVQEYGYITALVWGRVWRYCQMIDGVCRASTELIAGELGMSSRTIIRHLEILCDGGHLYDTTPNLRNKPHIYADTGKTRIKVSFEVISGMTQSHSDYDLKSHEESTTNSVFSIYESNIGILTPLIADALEDAEKEYPIDWITESILLAVTNNKRNWRYCETILKRWKENGKDDGKGKPKEQPKQEESHPEYKPIPQTEVIRVPRPANVPPPNIKRTPAY
jgi:DnaD/phage-associated family protein